MIGVCTTRRLTVQKRWKNVLRVQEKVWNLHGFNSSSSTRWVTVTVGFCSGFLPGQRKLSFCLLREMTGQLRDCVSLSIKTIHFLQQTTNDSCYWPDFLSRAKSCTRGDEVKTSLLLWSLLTVGHWRGQRNMAGADRPGPPPCPPPVLTIVHPPPDWALGEWVPVLCLDELIGKRCAAAPLRLSCPHQDADLDNTPRCSRTDSPGVAQVWQRLENSFVWEEGLKKMRFMRQ